MIRSKTVFIVGAGASCEVGFPLGTPLTSSIARALDFRNETADPAKGMMREAIRTYADRQIGYRIRHDELFAKASQISSALSTASSIDAFIYNHSDDPEVGLLAKLGIASCLIQAERESPLLPTRQRPFDLLKLAQQTWFGGLFHVLADGIKGSAIDQMFANVAFIVFNYDRCLEVYLEHAIASRFFLDLPKAREIVSQHCRIIHPYGSLGALEETDFGRAWPQRLSGEAIMKISGQLRTFTEALAGEERSAIKRAMEKATRLVFLGFGFHQQNMELLKPTKSDISEFRATVLGLSRNDQAEVLNQLVQFVHVPRHTNYVDHLLHCECRELIAGERQFLSR